MSDHTTTQDVALTRVGRCLAAFSVGLAAVGTIAVAVIGRWDFLIGDFVAHNAVLAVGLGMLGWVVIPAQPRNGAVWALTWSAFFASIYVAADVGGILLARSSFVDFSWAVARDLSLSELPTAAAIVSSPGAWTWIPAFFLMLTAGLLLFPDGQLPGRRWRWLGWFSIAAIAIVSAAQAWQFHPNSTASPGAEFDEYAGVSGRIVEYGFWFILAAAALSIVSLIVRYRQSSGEIRQQILLIAWGGASLTAALATGPIIVAFTSDVEALFDYLALMGEILLIASFAVAILKYRLYDIDVVISKTVTYALLAAFIAAVYVALVVGVSELIGGRSSFGLSVVATVVVAIVFQPARRWVQALANRLVYGRRSTPYEVLARFSRRAAESTDEELLARVPQLIVEGTSAASATLWVNTDGGFRTAASWPESEATTMFSFDKTTFVDPDADHSAPIFHAGELLGGISMVTGRGDTITGQEEGLLADLAAGMGLALRNAGLTSRLRAQVAELEASRERVLAASDEARRALENDLDSGPQQQLVALKVKLGPTRKLAEQAGAEKTAALLDQLEAGAGTAIQAVRDFAGGIYPPLLEAEGMAVAISQQTRNSAIPIDIRSDGLGRYGRDVEAAVYFSVLEALQNTAKYAQASSALVTISDLDGALRFEVSDDGRGFDAASISPGAGLTGMADRLDTVGGSLAIASSPDGGTVITGSVPVRELADA